MLPSPEFRRRILDKASIWIIAIAVFLGTLGAGWGLWEQHELVVINNSHHAQTADQNDTIETLLREHSASFAQQAKDAKQQAQYDVDVKELATELVQQEAAICAATGAQCPPLTIPGSTT